MRTDVLLQPLVLLVLALGIEAQDETANEKTTTEDGVFSTQYQSDNRLNTTDPPLKNKKSSATAGNDFTAGNTLCRSDQICSYKEGKKYSFCYVDYTNHWDYCCTGKCDYHKTSYLWCTSGNTWQYCGNAGTTNVDGRPCHYAHPCGMHQDKSKETTYWCYVDHRLNWNRCCAPSSTCDYHGYSYKWCYTGYQNKTSAYRCK